MALLIDVSNINGIVDWRKVAHAGVWGAWVKATEGHTFRDRLFTTNRQRAKEAGVHVGAYHFGRPDLNSPAAEAENFIHAVGKVNVGELRPVLDYEVSTRMSPAQHLSWLRDFNHAVRDALGVWPIFYSYPALVQSMHLSRTVGDGLWLASYGPNDGHRHGIVIPRPWRNVVAHQFMSNGRVAGVPGRVDLNFVAKPAMLLAHPVRGTLHRPIAAKRRKS